MHSQKSTKSKQRHTSTPIKRKSLKKTINNKSTNSHINSTLNSNNSTCESTILSMEHDADSSEIVAPTFNLSKKKKIKLIKVSNLPETNIERLAIDPDVDFSLTFKTEIEDNEYCLTKDSERLESLDSVKIDSSNAQINDSKNNVRVSNKYSENVSSENVIKAGLLSEILVKQCLDLEIEKTVIQDTSSAESTFEESTESQDNIPKICHFKLLKLLKDLENNNKELSDKEMHIVKCTRGMNPQYSAQMRFNSFSFITKAIKDSMLQRKWNNVTTLLIMLIEKYDSSQAVYIRNVMQILKLLNPLVKNSTLQNDIETISNNNKRGTKHFSNLTNIV